MRDFGPVALDKDKLENVKQTVREVKDEFLGTLRPKKNHLLFEVDFVNMTIGLAEFDKPGVLDYVAAANGDISHKKRITKKKDCIYISAMNIGNAKKQLFKRTGLEIK